MTNRFSVLLLLGVNGVFAQQYVINTFAGGAPMPTPVSALSSSVPEPSRLALDSTGNLYVTADSCVFVISTAGVMNRIAGTGRPGFAGDGGPATSAQLNVPMGLAVDPAGNIYIADSLNNRVRKVSATDGSISTVAGNGAAGFSGDGNAAAGATLNMPMGVALDRLGNLYIADTLNSRVRKATPGGVISTMVGTGTPGYSGDNGPAVSARIKDPTDVLIDQGGDLYIADSMNYSVRKVNSAGVITTLAGNGNWGTGTLKGGVAATSVSLGNVEALSFDGSGNLYLSDTYNWQIWRVSGSTIWTTTSVQTGPDYYGVEGIVADAAGNFYWADSIDNYITKVALSGAVNIIAGTQWGVRSLTGDGGPATQAHLGDPKGVTLDAAGNLYIADSDNRAIREVTPSGIITTITGKGGYGTAIPAANAGLGFPNDIASDPSGNLFITECGWIGVLEISAKTGLLTQFTGTDCPQGLATDSSGNVYITDEALNYVWKYTPQGKGTIIAGNGRAGYSGDNAGALSVDLNYPTGVAVDSAGDVYFADTLNQRIRKVTPGGVITTVAGNGTQGFKGDGGSATSAELNQPTAVALDGAGNLYISDTWNHRIRKVSADGTITTIAGNGTEAYSGDGGLATSAELNAPAGLQVDKTGNIYIADTYNEAIRVLSVMQPLEAEPAALPLGVTGTPYAARLAAAGGALPYTWSISAGALPAGLTLSSARAIAGVPTDAAVSTFSAMVTDGAQNTTTQSFRIVVTAPLSIPAATLAPGTIGVSYSQSLAASGGTPPYNWILNSGSLPAGLTLSVSGTISGAPSATGTSSFSVEATDSNSLTATQSFSIQVVNPAPAIATSATLPTAVTGLPYSQTLSATGGNPPLTWSGTVPVGLQLTPAGVISGTPTLAGAFTFPLTITDSDGLTATQTFQLTVFDSTTLSRIAVLPIALAGNGFTTTILLTNSSSNPVGVVAVERAGDGTLAAGNAPATLIAANGTFIVQIANPSVAWVDVLSSAALGASFAVQINGQPAGQTGIPLVTQFAPEYDVPYDNTSGQMPIGVALVNLSSTAATITATTNYFTKIK